jgi:hypothetical protein
MKLQNQPNEPKNNPIVSHNFNFGTKQINHAYLAWKLAVDPTFCEFYSFSTPHTSAASKSSTKTLYRRFTKLHHASQLKSAFPVFT